MKLPMLFSQIWKKIVNIFSTKYLKIYINRNNQSKKVKKNFQWEFYQAEIFSLAYILDILTILV